jgi:formylglycine-generating enzyme required for sulfatase activity
MTPTRWIPKVFISYSRKDAQMMEELRAHMAGTKSLLDLWADPEIRTGTEWEKVLWTNFHASDLIILLVSSSFLSSEYVGKELAAALKRHEAGEAILVPVLIRHCEWADTPLGRLQMLCAKKPVYGHGREEADRDEAWVSVVREIKRFAVELAEKRVAAPKVEAPRSAPAIIIHRPGDTTEIGGLPYVWIPPGKFLMGASEDDTEAEDRERPQHEVTITKGFWLGKTPVTQEAYEHAMGVNPSNFQGPGRPVECVSWNDAQAYAKKVGLHLPTEAEWEYAARAGTTGSRYGELDKIAWFGGNSGGGTHDVGLKDANEFGLHDMLGNVWEWVEDFFGEYGSGPATDPQGPKAGTLRVLRGGSWSHYPGHARASCRYRHGPGLQFDVVGFRCRGN